MFKKTLRWFFSIIFRVKLVGLEHLEQAGERVLMVANHASFLDPPLLWAFLPDNVTFAINTHIAEHPLVKASLRFVHVFPMDPAKPMSIRTLTHHLKENSKAVIFPEGRITVTGSLMKVYAGAGLVADKADAVILPIRIEGTQYTFFSRMKGVVPLRWFPRITLTFLPSQKLSVPHEIKGEERHKLLGLMLEDLMSDMVFASGYQRRTIFAAILEARKIHGGDCVVLEDLQRNPLDYDGLITRALAISSKLKLQTQESEAVGLLLPSINTTVATILALQIQGRVPTMLNFSTGARNMLIACQAARVKTVISSRRFVEMAKLENAVEQLSGQVRIFYLEDMVISAKDKAFIWLNSLYVRKFGIKDRDPDSAAVILFTSGSEGAPKGVALSHANLLSNREQLIAKLDLNAQDNVLNALPLFHSFGFMAGTIAPLLSGMKTFLYPSPLHYRIIPEIAYDINATILFGANTFLAGYAKHAHPYDFYSVRYVFSSAERLQESTRNLWMEKFGIRILEAYGATETSPALAVNTLMHYRAGTVGRFLPNIAYKLEPVQGIDRGGRLHVTGPNVMLGYLTADQPGKLLPPESSFGKGWYDTGDLVEVDSEGFVKIIGRIKRFAKIGGEMVSLSAVEECAASLWLGAHHAAISVADAKKGEQIILLTDYPRADRNDLLLHARSKGFSEIYIPKIVLPIETMPLLASGKLDYPSIQALWLEHA